MIAVQHIIERFQLTPLTIEGGYYRETYRSALTLPAAALPNEYGGDRNVSTAIYYLLTPGATGYASAELVSSVQRSVTW